jgi:hypothetical protein
MFSTVLIYSATEYVNVGVHCDERDASRWDGLSSRFRQPHQRVSGVCQQLRLRGQSFR